MNRASFRVGPSVFLALAVVVGSAAGPAAQTIGEGEEFSAFAVNMGALTSGSTGTTAQLIITVRRWSSEKEKNELLAILREKGQEEALRTLSRYKSVGTLRTAQSVGYDMRLAFEETGKDGQRRVLVFADRPVGFLEASYRPPSIEYPFSVIDMRLPAEGKGQGTLSLAAKIIPAGKNLVVENYDTQPVQLNQIESRKLTKR